MAKVDAKGRSRGDHHVRLYDWLTGSEAWRNCSGGAIKLLIYIATFDRGNNNGAIYMSERVAANGIGADRKTARKLLKELQDKGFIACTSEGSFKAKRSPAAQWRLTFKSWPAMSKGPTNEWRRWRTSKKSRGEILPHDGPIITHSPADEASDGPIIPPSPNAEPQKTANQEWGNNTPQLIAIGEGASDGKPVDLIRATVLEWWRVSDKSDRLKLAKKMGSRSANCSRSSMALAIFRSRKRWRSGLASRPGARRHEGRGGR